MISVLMMSGSVSEDTSECHSDFLFFGTNESEFLRKIV